MALEDLTGTNKYIANLVNTNPLSADDRREGDDHIRGIKNVLLNTFPGVSGPFLPANYVLKAGDAMTGPLRLPDTPANNPALAWANETGLGWYRVGGGVRGFAVGGATVETISTNATQSFFAIFPRANAGKSQLSLYENVQGNAQQRQVFLSSGPTVYTLGESVAGGAAPQRMQFGFPAGIDTTGPLAVTGSLNASGDVVAANLVYAMGGALVARGASPAVSFQDGAGAEKARIYADGTGTLRINANGRIWLYQNDGTFAVPGPAYKPGGGSWADSNSDARSKEAIKPYTRGLADILAYEPISYRYKAAMQLGSRTYIGRLAGAVKAVDPSMVHVSPIQGMGFDDLETIDSSADLYKVFNAIKTLHERIEALELLCAGIGDA